MRRERRPEAVKLRAGLHDASRKYRLHALELRIKFEFMFSCCSVTDLYSLAHGTLRPALICAAIGLLFIGGCIQYYCTHFRSPTDDHLLYFSYCF